MSSRINRILVLLVVVTGIVIQLLWAVGFFHA